MAEKGKISIIKAAKELNVATSTIRKHLDSKGFEVNEKPTVKLSKQMYDELLLEFQSDKALREEAEKIEIGKSYAESVDVVEAPISKISRKDDQTELLIKTQSDVAPPEEEKQVEEPPKEEKPDKKKEEKLEVTKADVEKLAGPTVVGKIELEKFKSKSKKGDKAKEEKVKEKESKNAQTAETEKQPAEKVDNEGEAKHSKKLVASSSDEFIAKRKKRRIITTSNKLISKDATQTTEPKTAKVSKGRRRTPEIDQKEIKEQVKATLAKLTTKSKTTKHKKVKKDKEEGEGSQADEGTIQVTEFISVSEIATMMDVPVTDVLTACMDLGVVASINQRLDAEIIELLGESFGFKVKFIDLQEQEDIEVEEEESDPEDLVKRPPIVVVMGHVDHGKTRLLDQIGNTNVVAGESGGITQHVGAYSIEIEGKERITFLDTPGHEAFTAMRARGAKSTDIAVIVIAADEEVMPQTKEAISHAQVAGIKMIFAINKMDKPNADPEKIKEQLSNMDLLVEDWGGKYQSQELAAKTGENVDKLLEKILLEAEMLDLKADPNKPAIGTVLEASLDKGKGYVTTVLVHSGTLHIGDIVVAGNYFGKIKAMMDERGNKMQEAGPSIPAQIMGLNGAAQAGDKIKVTSSEQEAKNIALARQRILREQSIRTTKHMTLDEIGRRLALGNFKELNLIIKGDVDGSVEALSDSLLKLSTDEVVVNIVHKAVGQITESDILLATASDAIVIGFQVRPSLGARKTAEAEDIEIRHYSIIYDAIDEIKSAIEGLHAPVMEEKVTCSVEIKEIFKVTRVGTVAGCYVTDGKITRKNKIRVIRDGVVVYTGELSSLKRFKDDAKEVPSGMECGLTIENFNDIKVGDIIEGFESVEVKKRAS